MADHNPLPPHLHDQIGVPADLKGKETSASNAVFVISQALGAVYRAGHCDGMAQAKETKWITDQLEQQLAAKSKAPTRRRSQHDRTHQAHAGRAGPLRERPPLVGRPGSR